jgi:hypothetical protein
LFSHQINNNLGFKEETKVEMLQNSIVLQDCCVDPTSGFVCNDKVMMRGNAQFNLIAPLAEYHEDDEL